MAIAGTTETRNHLYDLGIGMSRPQVFECNDGVDRVVKVPGLCSLAALTSDWLGALLAVHLGLLTPAPALVTVTRESIRSMPPELGRAALPGVGFGTTYITSAQPVLGVASIEACSNHSDILARTTALDVWIGTLDRMTPNFGRNLLIDAEDGHLRLMAIDFGMAFTDVLVQLVGTSTTPDPVAVIDRRIRTLLDLRALSAAIADIESITNVELLEFGSTVPQAWISEQTRQRVIDFLSDRRLLVRAAVAKGLAA